MGYALKEPPDHRVKPDGGYVHVSTFRIGIVWWCYLAGTLSLRAVRAFLALQEMGIERATYVRTERKQGRGVPEFTPRFGVWELAKHCGLPEKRARDALNELLALGLVTEFGEQIRYASSIAELTLSESDRSEFWEWFTRLTKRKRVPFPRRILVLACESSGPAQIACILGAVLRCVYLLPKDGGFKYSGWLSMSWLSDRFGISLRAAKAAKSHLVELGWVKPTGRVGRFGELVAINPAWERILATVEGRESFPQAEQEAPSDGPNPAPLSAPFGPNPARPKTRASSFGTENFTPRESLPPVENPGPGFCQKPGGEKPQDKTPALPQPRLSAIRLEDLASVERLLGERGLFAQGVRAKLFNEGEANRIYFVACAERARTCGARNPCGVFNVMMKNHAKFTGHISQEQENAARLRIQVWRKQREDAERATATPFLVPNVGLKSIGETPRQEPRHTLSPDAELVKSLRIVLRQHGVRNPDPLPHLRRHDASWNRERLLAAELELSRPNYLEAAR
jgi:hypothetical protein